MRNGTTCMRAGFTHQNHSPSLKPSNGSGVLFGVRAVHGRVAQLDEGGTRLRPLPVQLALTVFLHRIQIAEPDGHFVVYDERDGEQPRGSENATKGLLLSP